MPMYGSDLDCSFKFWTREDWRLFWTFGCISDLPNEEPKSKEKGK